MTQQIINTGSGPDSYTGDTLRTAFEKTNENFNELYALAGESTTANLEVNSLAANTITVAGNLTALAFYGDGSHLTGVTSYANSNVASYLPIYSGNVNAAYYFGDGRHLTGITTYSNSNVASYLPLYSGNVNAAYYFGDGSHLTGLTTLGNLIIDGPTNQTIVGTVPGALKLIPFAGNVVTIETQFDSTGIASNLLIGSLGINSLGIRPAVETNGNIANFTLGANLASMTFNPATNAIVFNANNPSGYGYRFNNGSVYGREFYAEANFPTGYQFNTPLGDTGLSHSYDTTQGNVSLIRIRHDSVVPAKFYDNNTTELAGNLVVIQGGSSAGSFPNAFVQTYSTANTYTQFIWQNLSNGGAATGDIVVTSDDGTDTTNFIDLGMTSSGYDPLNPNNSLGTSVGANDGYLYVQGDGLGGNLTIGAVDAGKVTKVIAGGVNAEDVIAIFSADGIMPGANVAYSLGSQDLQWKDLWVSNNTIYLGSFPLTITEDGVLQVNGAPVGTGNLTAANIGTLTVTGLTTLDGTNVTGNLIVSGTTRSIGNTISEGTTETIGTFTANGVSNLIGIVNTTGNVNIGGNLVTTGTLVTVGTTQMIGNTITQGTTSLIGNVGIIGNVNAIGAILETGNLTVLGITNLVGNVGLTGMTTQTGNIAIDGNMLINNQVTFSGTGNLKFSDGSVQSTAAIAYINNSNHVTGSFSTTGAQRGVELTTDATPNNTASTIVSRAADGNIAVSNVTMSTFRTTALANSSVAGSLIVFGNLDVRGTTSTVNSTNIVVTALTITVANTATTSAQTNGAGLLAGDGTIFADWLYDDSQTAWRTNISIVPAVDGVGSLGNTDREWAQVHSTNAHIHNKLTVGEPPLTSYATVAQFTTNVNTYSQITTQNINTQNNASTDYVAIADNGNEEVNYIDMGINSSTYANVDYSITKANDGYLYNNGGNLTVGTQTPNKAVVFHTGGTTADKEAGRISVGRWLLNAVDDGTSKLQVGGVIKSNSNIVTTSGFVGTLLTNAQPNITSVGTLSSLSIGANLTVGGSLIVGNITSIGANANFDGRLTLNASDVPTYQGALTVVGTASGNVVVPQNTGVMIHATGVEGGTPSRIYNDGIANYSAYIGRRYNGNVAAPTVVTAGQIISRIGATPYIGGANLWPTVSTTRIDFVAAETQSNVAQGSNIQFWTTAIGSNVITQSASLNGTGLNVTANVTASRLISTVATGTAPFTVTSTTKVAGLNVEQVDGFDASQASTANTIVVRDANSSIAANVVNATSLTGNGSALTSLTGANVNGTVANAAYSTQSGQANSANISTSATFVTGLTSANVTTALGYVPLNSNASISSAGTAQFVTNSTQSNITSVGTLVSLSVTGNVSAGNVNSNTFGVHTGAVTGNVTGTILTASQPNITTVGTLASLAVTGNVTAGNVNSNTFGVHTGNVSGTILTAAQPNITSVGTLSSLAVTGNITAANISLTNNVIAAFGVYGNITIGNNAIISTSGSTDVNIGLITSTANVNINRTANFAKDAAVTGNVSATSYTGSGSLLTGVFASNDILKGTLSINPASVNKTAASTQTFTLTGLTTNHKIIVSAATSLAYGIFIAAAWPSATDTLSIHFMNVSGGAIDLGVIDVDYVAWI